MVHDKVDGPAWRSCAIAGSATLTTEPSTNARLEPSMVAASVARGCAVVVTASSRPPTRGLPLRPYTPHCDRHQQAFGIFADDPLDESDALAMKLLPVQCSEQSASMEHEHEQLPVQCH